MFESVRAFFEGEGQLKFDMSGELSPRDLQIAACVLLIETALVDKLYKKSEERTIVDIMNACFDITGDVAQELMGIAAAARSHRDRMAVFLDNIHKSFSVKQKQLIYAAVWKVIKADGVIDPRELETSGVLGRCLDLSVDEEIAARRMIVEKLF